MSLRRPSERLHQAQTAETATVPQVGYDARSGLPAGRGPDTCTSVVRVVLVGLRPSHRTKFTGIFQQAVP